MDRKTRKSIDLSLFEGRWKILNDISGSHSCMSILLLQKMLGNLYYCLKALVVVSTWLLFDERYGFCHHHLKMVKVYNNSKG